MDLRPSSISTPLAVSNVTHRSPISFTSQTFNNPGAMFGVSAQFPPLTQDQHKKANVFISKLRGEAGRFYFPMNCCAYGIPDTFSPERVTLVPFTVDTIEITVDSTRVTVDRTTIPYESFYASDGLSTDPTVITGTLWINSGLSRLELDGYLSWDDTAGYRHLHHIVGIDKVGGKTNITVEPPMRFIPTASTPIHVKAPSGIFKLTADNVGALTRGSNGRSEFSVTLEQAWPAQFTL
jgi:hypothetical protein